MRITPVSALLLIYFIVIIIWWFVIYFSGSTAGVANYAYVFIYGLIPFSGGVLGLLSANKWGFLKSTLGKALIFLSLGLITWSGGETIWSIYNLVLKVEIPYPSWADASFIVSWPLWCIGILYLSSATGAKFGLRAKMGKLQLVILPIVSLIISYYLLIVVARQGSLVSGGGLLKIFFDLAYPFLDVVILTLALLVYGLSFKFLGGRFKWPVLIILSGFVINYFADFSFSYTTTIGTYYNANWSDLLFTIAMFVLRFGVNSFDLKDE